LLVVASGCENPKPAVPTSRAKTVADIVRDVQPSIVLIRVGGTRVNPVPAHHFFAQLASASGSRFGRLAVSSAETTRPVVDA